MRIAPFLLIVALAAGGASAQPALRGAVQPAPASQPVPAAQPAAPSPAPTLIGPLSSTPPLADRCLLTCASDYYVCLSTETADDCAPNWMQCRSNCAAAARR